MNLSRFRRRLLQWYESNARALPWRQTREPYAIWLSEVMLQQTRVVAVIPYYERFLTLFPTVEALAVAPEQQLLAAWAGLGYYSRARNLQRAARDIVVQGGFPTRYEDIAALAGIGAYTAAAVASIAFDLPYESESSSHSCKYYENTNIRALVNRCKGQKGAPFHKQISKAICYFYNRSPRTDTSRPF